MMPSDNAIARLAEANTLSSTLGHHQPRETLFVRFSRASIDKSFHQSCGMTVMLQEVVSCEGTDDGPKLINTYQRWKIGEHDVE